MCRRVAGKAEHEVLLYLKCTKYLITTLTLDQQTRFFSCVSSVLLFVDDTNYVWGGKKLYWTSMFLCRTVLKEGLLLPEPSILSSHYSFLFSPQQVHPKGEPLLWNPVVCWRRSSSPCPFFLTLSCIGHYSGQLIKCQLALHFTSVATVDADALSHTQSTC